MRRITVPAAVAISLAVGVATIALAQTAASSSDATFKVAYYNIQSGMGTTQLTGICSFERIRTARIPRSLSTRGAQASSRLS